MEDDNRTSEAVASLTIGLDAAVAANDALQALIDAVSQDIVRQTQGMTIDQLYIWKDRGCDLMLQLLALNFPESTPLHRTANFLSQLEACRRAVELIQHGCASQLISLEDGSARAE